MAHGPIFNKQRKSWYVEYFDGKRWRRVTVARGPKKWEPGDRIPSPPPEAKAAFSRWEEEEKAARAGRAKGQPTDLASFLEDHVASYSKEGTRRLVRQAADQFLAWCRSEGISQFAEIDKAACNRFLRHAVLAPEGGGEPPTMNTMRTRRAFLAAAWGKLADEEVIERSPWKGTTLRGSAKVKPRNAWTIDQYRKLLDAAEPWLRDVLVIGVNTGLRIEALMKIEWRDWIHPEPGELHLGYLRVREEISKTGEYKVPVSEELHDLLSRRFGKHHPTFILTAKRGGTLKYSTQTGKAIVKACAVAGLPRPTSPNHHLRRTFGRFAVLGHLTGKPVPIYVASRWFGHKTPKTTLTYLGLDEEDSAKWMLPGIYADATAAVTPAENATPTSATPPSP